MEEETSPRSEGISSPLSIVTSRNVGVRLEETVLGPASVVIESAECEIWKEARNVL